MRTRTGTGYAIAVLLAFALVCSGVLVAQDKILVPNKAQTPDPNSVNCWKYAADGTTCLVGQYLRGDGTKWSSSFGYNAAPNSFVGWAANNISSPTFNGFQCADCHKLDGTGIKDANMTPQPSRGELRHWRPQEHPSQGCSRSNAAGYARQPDHHRGRP